MSDDPRTFAELAQHARDVQTTAREMDTRAFEDQPAADQCHAIAFQVERLAAQVAEGFERLAAQP